MNMKLTNKKLLQLLSPSFSSFGYTFFKGKDFPSGLFVKRENDLFMTLGLNIHRFYDDSFTMDMYLSTTTRFACWWGDIPFRSYTRPGYYLTDDELINYREEGSKLIDIWWDCSSVSIDDFLRVFRIAEKRKFSDTVLIDSIRQSKDVARLYEMSKLVRESVEKRSSIEGRDILFSPNDKNMRAPAIWHEEAERVLLSLGSSINSLAIVSLAEDSFRQFVLK